MSEQAETDLNDLESDSAPIVSEEAPDETLEETEQVETPETETASPEQQESAGIQKRFKKLTADKWTERQRAEAAEARVVELESNQQPAQTEPPPNYDDFDTDAEYYAATAKHEATQAIEGFKVELAQGKVKDDRADALQGFSAKVAAANIPNYDVKANLLMDSVGMRPDTLQALYELEGDAGPKLVAYLADHLEVAEGISPVKLGQLSAKLSALKPVQQTKASAPIVPVKPGGAVRKNLSDLSMDELIDGDLSSYGINDR